MTDAGRARADGGGAGAGDGADGGVRADGGTDASGSAEAGGDTGADGGAGPDAGPDVAPDENDPGGPDAVAVREAPTPLAGVQEGATRAREGATATAAALRDRDVAAARAAAGVGHDHAPGTLALVVLFALGIGVGLSWLLADLGLRLAALLAGWLGGGYWLYRKPDRRAVVVAGLYAVAALVALVPVAMNVTALAVAGGHGMRAGPFALSMVDVVVLVVFLVLAVVPAGMAWVLERRGG